MGRIIGAVAFVLVVALIVWLIRYKLKQNERIADKEAGRAVNGDLSAKEERAIIAENDAAAAIYQRLLDGMTVDNPWQDFTIMPQDTKDAINAWMTVHKKRKESS